MTILTANSETVQDLLNEAVARRDKARSWLEEHRDDHTELAQIALMQSVVDAMQDRIDFMDLVFPSLSPPS